MTHTKEPWHLHDMEAYTVVGPDHLAIALVDAVSRSSETNEANARLIAAAPEMLATLKSMRNTLLRLGGDPMPTLDAVIAKAEGL